MEGITETLSIAKQILGAAYSEVENQTTQLINQCRQTQNDTYGCIQSAMQKAITSAYTTKANVDKVIVDNLAYLMSAAQQYASILGYAPIYIDLSGVPANVPRTLDVADPLSPGGVDVNQPLTPGQYNVVPRYAGYPDDPSVSQPLTYNVVPDNPDKSAWPHIGPAPEGLIQQPPQTTLVQPSPVSPTGLGVGIQPPGTVLSPGPSVTGQVTTPVGVPPATVSPVGTAIGSPMPPILPAGPTGVSIQPIKGLPASQRSRIGPNVNIPPVVGRIGESNGTVTAPPSPGTATVTPPTSTGCPTSTVGLPDSQSLMPFGPIMPREGMYVLCGNMVAYLTSDLAVANQMGSCIEAVANGVTYYGIVDPSCPINQNLPTPIIGPQPLGPIPPKPPPDNCNNLPASMSNWTPWQLANCGRETIPTSCPAPVVACPAPIINVSMVDLCNCIKGALQDTLPVPVDLDQPLAFKFSSDDLAWKKNATAFYGKELVDYNDASDMDAFSHSQLADILEPHDSSD